MRAPQSRPHRSRQAAAVLAGAALVCALPAGAQVAPSPPVLPDGGARDAGGLADGTSAPAADELDHARAVRCLTQAVYYEAGFEPREGQEAVAQVVLNRLMHPAFPKSVCGVVFEGSERRTGCQFTFTCDGSLARPPERIHWEAAQAVAAAALDGHVDAEVGASTHYHAAWMTPYWSASLVRTRRIAGHIFYRMPSARGGAAPTGRYAGAEPETPVGRPPDGATAPGPARTPPARPGVSQFSVWGIEVATVAARRGSILVRSGL